MHGPVQAEQEQRDRGVSEHRPEQAALGDQRAGGRCAVLPGRPAADRAEHGHRGVQLGEGRVEQRAGLGTGQAGRLPQRGITVPEPGQFPVEFRQLGGLLHARVQSSGRLDASGWVDASG